MENIMSKEDPDYIPDYEEFVSDVQKIYSIGDIQKGYKDMLFHVNNHKMQNGDPVTWKIIITQYEAHIAWWDYMYKAKERNKMLPKEAEGKRHPIDFFIREKMYNRVWIVSKGTKQRDEYIFTKLPIDNLLKQLNKFKLQWTTKRHYHKEDPETENS